MKPKESGSNVSLKDDRFIMTQLLYFLHYHSREEFGDFIFVYCLMSVCQYSRVVIGCN